MNTNKSIAFVHYPYDADNALLESMPFALNIVRVLDRSGWKIDLYIWEKDTSVYSDYFSDRVKIKKINSCNRRRLFKREALSWLNYLNDPFIRLDVLKAGKYQCIFGLGQVGIYLAGLMSRKSRSPYIYINDEFPSSYPTSAQHYWHRRERQAVADSTLIIVPDEQRIKTLSDEMSLKDADVQFAVLPNAVDVSNENIQINWHDRLGLPPDSIPFLHAGSVSDWAQVPEILSSITYWPENAVLVINSRTPVSESYKTQLSHLLVKNRVFWSERPLREQELNSLVKYCAGSFALYRDLGDNIKYIGWSSGKLLRSIMCGRPVIASRLPSLDFVEKNELGRLVTHPSEIPEAVSDLINRSAAYGSNCKAYADNEINFDIWWNRATDKFRQLTDISLN